MIPLLLFLFSFCLPLVGEEFCLSLNEEEKYAIREIYTSMGEKNIARLIFEGGRLTALGNSIEHVPPLQFLGYALTDPYLRQCLLRISESRFKWPFFLDGFSTSMEQELSRGQLLEELPAFAKWINCPYEKLKALCYKHDWDTFVRILL